MSKHAAKSRVIPSPTPKEAAWLARLTSDMNLSAGQILALFQEDDSEIRPLFKEKGYIALKANPIYRLIMLEDPSVVKYLSASWEISAKDAKMLLCIAGNAQDNAHDMRGEPFEEWSDQLFASAAALREFSERFPSERTAEILEMENSLIEQIVEQGEFSILKANALLNQWHETHDYGVLQDRLCYARAYFDGEEEEE